MFCKAELCKTFLKTCGEKLGLQRFHRFPSIVLSTMQLCKFYFLLIKALLWKTCVSCVFESLCVYTKTFEGNTNTGAKHPKEKHWEHKNIREKRKNTRNTAKKLD
jgi:hypothetical protein